MASIEDIEGIGQESGAKLRQAGVATTEALLKRGATSKGRQDLAEATGLAPDRLLRWVNHADLYRIKGVGAEYSELLERAGVDTVPELAQRNATNLHQRLVELHEQTGTSVTRRVPTETQVADWIEQAKQLPRMMEH